MDTGQETLLEEDIAENAFFQDFLLFLREAGTRPLGLTKTGNLKRAEIYYFGEHFAIDIYHRNTNGTIMFPIRTEYEAPHLLRIRLIARVMKLVYSRKSTLLLSKKGKIFLDQSPPTRFDEMIHSYFIHCNWGYMHPTLYELARTLQEEQFHFWNYFLQQQNKPIDFQQFVQGVSFYFGLKTTNDYHNDVQWALEYVLIKDLALFDLLDVKTVKDGWKERIVSFQPTDVGVYIFKKSLFGITKGSDDKKSYNN